MFASPVSNPSVADVLGKSQQEWEQAAWMKNLTRISPEADKDAKGAGVTEEVAVSDDGKYALSAEPEVAALVAVTLPESL